MTPRVRGVRAAAIVSVDVSEHGATSVEGDCVRRSNERPRGDDHLIARSKTEPEKRRLQRNGAIGESDRVRRAHEVREGGLETASGVACPVADPTGPQHVCGGRDLVGGEARPRRKRCRTRGHAAVDCESAVTHRRTSR
jgi:hypothetical protein